MGAYGSYGLDLAAYRQIAFLARKDAREFTEAASKALGRKGDPALEEAAHETAGKAARSDDPIALAQALRASLSSIASALDHAAEALDPASALDPDTPMPVGSTTVSSPPFIRSVAALSAKAAALCDMEEVLVEALGPSGGSDLDPDAVEPAVAELMVGHLAERLVEALPGGIIPRKELDAAWSGGRSLERIADAAGGFPFAACRDGFFGMPVVVTGRTGDLQSFTGFTTAGFVPDLKQAFDETWRLEQAVSDDGSARWHLVETSQDILEKSLDDFAEFGLVPHVDRYLRSMSPKAASANLGVSTVKMNSWLRGRDLLLPDGAPSRFAVACGAVFVEHTKFGPKLSWDAGFIEALVPYVPEMASSKVIPKPPEPPSWNQLRYARKLAKDTGRRLPDGWDDSAKACSAAIDTLKAVAGPTRRKPYGRLSAGFSP
jgi:hypothetical protein